MGIIIDLIIIAIITLCIIFGYKKGLIGVLFKILSFIIAIIITLILYKPVTTLVINATTIDDNIQNAIYSKLQGRELIVENSEELREQEVPDNIINNINKYINNATGNSEGDIALLVAKQLTLSILNVIVAIVLFIVIKLVLLLAKAVFNKIAELPVINQFNKLGGILYGVVKGILVVYLILALATLILPMTNDATVITGINNSFIGSVMYNNNIILKILF